MTKNPSDDEASDSNPSAENTRQQTLTGDIRTRLVNQKTTESWDVDIGRANNGRNDIQTTEVGEPGWLGNPFAMSDGYSREAAVEKYREVFVERIRNDDEFREAVDELHGKTLACYCKPKDCHGDVILSYLHGEMDIEEESSQ